MFHTRPFDIGLVVSILTVLLSGMVLLDGSLVCVHLQRQMSCRW
jgi:hypothetical protein